MKLSPSKYAREYLRHLPPGYRVAFQTKHDGPASARRGRGKHRVLIDPSGDVVRGPDGRLVTVCSTPSGYNNLRQDLQRAKRAGVEVT